MDRGYQIRLRDAAAGLIKSLIRARVTQERDFLSQSDLKRWKIEDAVSDTRSTAELLRRIRRLRTTFENKFANNQDSIASADSVTVEEQLDQLIDQVASFITSDLDEAIEQAVLGHIVWDGLANWSQLANLRNALDRLPITGNDNAESPESPVPIAQSKSVVLYGLRESPVVLGKTKPELGPTQYELIKRLIEAGENRCSKSKLEQISSDYWKSLQSLKKSDPDWDAVIHFPGKSHRGYWID